MMPRYRKYLLQTILSVQDLIHVVFCCASPQIRRVNFERTTFGTGSYFFLCGTLMMPGYRKYLLQSILSAPDLICVVFCYASPQIRRVNFERTTFGTGASLG